MNTNGSVASRLTEFHLFPMLRVVFDGTLPEMAPAPIGKNMVRRHKITSDNSRLLVSAMQTWNAELVKRKGGWVNAEMVAQVNRRTAMLGHLVALSLGAENSNLIYNFDRISIGVDGKDWVVGSPNDAKWETGEKLFDQSTVIANSFIDRIAAIVCERDLEIDDQGLKPVGADEEVIQTVEDVVVKALQTLLNLIRAEAEKSVLASEVLDEMKFKDVKALSRRLNHYEVLRSVCSDLVQERLVVVLKDSAQEFPCAIEIRKGWKIVAVPPETVCGCCLQHSGLPTLVLVGC